MIDLEENLDKTDEELVRLTLQKEDYFLCLMKRYENKLLGYILRISNINLEEAEDILQDVFIKVYQNLNNFNSDLKFSSWIYRITHNQVISNYRKIKARPENVAIDDKLANVLSSDLDLNKDMDDQIKKEQIKKALKKIDLKYREIIILKFLEEKSYQEISDIITKPIGTVATLIKRAKQELANVIKKEGLKF